MMQIIFKQHKLFIILIFATIWIACQEEEENKTPVIHSVTPAMAFDGDTITILGEHFAPYLYDNFVTFNGKIAVNYLGGNTRRLTVVVPYGATSGSLIVDAGHQLSQPMFYEVGRRQVEIYSITPNNTGEASFGSVVRIEGKNFIPQAIQAGTASFYFTGLKTGEKVRAAVVNVTSSWAEVNVPLGIRTGPISLIQEEVTYEGPVFTVVAPAITAANPTEAFEGTKVVLTGERLSNITEIYLNNRPIAVMPVSDAELNFVIPLGTGIGTFPVSLMVDGEIVPTAIEITIREVTDVVHTVFYTNSGTAYRSTTDASGNVTEAPLPFTDVYFIAYDEQIGRIFFMQSSRFSYCNKDGSGAVTIDLSVDPVGVGYPFDGAVSGNKLYWADFSSNQIKSINTDGTGGIQILYGEDPAEGINQPFGIEVAGNSVYWTEGTSRRLMRGNVSGAGAPEEVVVNGPTLYYLLDVDIVVRDGKELIFVVDEPAYAGSSDPARIYTGELSGGNPLTLKPLNVLEPEQGGIKQTFYVTVQSGKGKVLWGSNTSSYILMQSDLDGGNVERIETNGNRPYDNFYLVE